MRRFLGIGLALVLCIGVVPATASTFVAMSPEALVAQADAVIQGEVVNLSSFWTESDRLVATEALVTVDEVIAGDAPSTVTVRTFGGQVGDFKVEAHGFPTFQRNERVLLFLEWNADEDAYRVLGYQQGQFRVVTRLDGVTLAVPMVDEGARFFHADGRLAPEPRSTEIETFKSTVRDLAERVRPDNDGPRVK